VECSRRAKEPRPIFHSRSGPSNFLLEKERTSIRMPHDTPRYNPPDQSETRDRAEWVKQGEDLLYGRKEPRPSARGGKNQIDYPRDCGSRFGALIKRSAQCRPIPNYWLLQKTIGSRRDNVLRHGNNPEQADPRSDLWRSSRLRGTRIHATWHGGGCGISSRWVLQEVSSS